MNTMKKTQLFTLIGAGLFLITGLIQVQAQELKFVMCGGEVRASDQKVIDAFNASDPGV